MAYIPTHVTQKDGSLCQWKNCWAAVGAWLVDGATRGDTRPTPETFRGHSKQAGDDCTTGGLGSISTGMLTLGIAVRRWNDVSLEDARQMIAKPRSRRLYAFETDFIEWPEDLKCQTDFDGAHMVGVAPSTYAAATDTIRTMDPLCTVMKRVPIEAVLACAAAYNHRHGGTIETVDILSVLVPERPEE